MQSVMFPLQGEITIPGGQASATNDNNGHNNYRQATTTCALQGEATIP